MNVLPFCTYFTLSCSLASSYIFPKIEKSPSERKLFCLTKKLSQHLEKAEKMVLLLGHLLLSLSTWYNPRNPLGARREPTSSNCLSDLGTHVLACADMLVHTCPPTHTFIPIQLIKALGKRLLSLYQTEDLSNAPGDRLSMLFIFNAILISGDLYVHLCYLHHGVICMLGCRVWKECVSKTERQKEDWCSFPNSHSRLIS